MKLFFPFGRPSALVVLIILCFPMFCLAEVINVKSTSGDSVVTDIVGKATVIKKGTSSSVPLLKGATLAGGDKVTTDLDSRIEIKLPDNSYIRFDEETTFVLDAASVDEQNNSREVKVNMVLGKTWANVNNVFGKRGSFAISTKTAVAGVRGTVYRLNANKDNSTKIKVYWGEVAVSSRYNKPSNMAPGKIDKPYEVLGPHTVSGPHEVTMSEWTYIVKAMQQVTVSADGSAKEPEAFSEKDDLSEWVMWNKNRDAAIIR